MSISNKSSFKEKIPDFFIRSAASCGNSDALLRQVTYSPLEKSMFVGESTDPVGDHAFVKTRGILQKYHGRALLLLTGACFGHCRYCFRKNFSYEQQSIRKQDLDQIVVWLQKNKDVTEIILSGGDPLFVSNAKLCQVLDALATVDTLQVIRVHTRVLSFQPQRIDEGLLRVFSGRKWKVMWVSHFNHMGEIVQDVKNSIEILRKIPDIIFLNQSVLLNGVNDTAEDLILLSESLFNVGILPYYLHQLDKVEGSGHFEVSIEKGKSLISAMRERVPGYLVPKYVQEICGEKSKTPII